jgi:hypothetical protein
MDYYMAILPELHKGDRVSYPEDVYKTKSKKMYGNVSHVYYERSQRMYEVTFDNGMIRRGFFRHGLQAEADNAGR